MAVALIDSGTKRVTDGGFGSGDDTICTIPTQGVYSLRLHAEWDGGGVATLMWYTFQSLMARGDGVGAAWSLDSDDFPQASIQTPPVVLEGLETGFVEVAFTSGSWVDIVWDLYLVDVIGT